MIKRNASRDLLKPKPIGKHMRLLTVCYFPQPKSRRPVPWIRLSGLWLEQAGFTPRSAIRVRVMPDCLVITKE